MKFFTTLLGLAAILLLPFSVKADEGWTITSFATDLVIETNGQVRVTEAIDVDFGSLEKHGIYRDIPYRYSNPDGTTTATDIADVAVTDGSVPVPYALSATNANFRIKIGDPDRTISGVNTYRISYTVTGVVRTVETGDELYWNTTGNDWPVPIEQATASITLPSNVQPIASSCYQGPRGSTNRCETPDTRHFVSSQVLAPGGGLTVALSYPSNVIPILVGTGELPIKPFDPTSPLTVGGFVLPIIGTLLFLVFKWRAEGRDSASGPSFRQTVTTEFEPPAKLKPAEIGVLMDERADLTDLSATIVDLATQGFLTIAEIPKQGFFGQKDFLLTRTSKQPEQLAEYEQQILTALFANSSPTHLSSLKNKFYTHLNPIKQSLYELVTKQGLFDSNPEKVRRIYIGSGIGMSVLALLTLVVLRDQLGAMGIGMAAGSILAGLIVLFGSFLMPRRSAKGSELFRQAKGYKLFLTTTEKDRAPFFEKEGIFTKLLPYAMVFGVTSQLARVFNELGIQPQAPVWYTGSHPFTPIAFASDINNFSTALSSTLASSPSSSGSGGGGSSGGGFGGGGGGSW